MKFILNISDVSLKWRLLLIRNEPKRSHMLLILKLSLPSCLDCFQRSDNMADISQNPDLTSVSVTLVQAPRTTSFLLTNIDKDE